MTALRQEAHQIIDKLPEEVLLSWIHLFRGITQQTTTEESTVKTDTNAFERLEAARKEIHAQLPENFDPDRALAEAKHVRFD